jgi:hypothetical protein
MRRFPLAAALLSLIVFLPLIGQAQTFGPKIYIAPANGFETFLSAAFTKKNVPATPTQNSDGADFVLQSTPPQQNRKSTGSIIARCLFASCIGALGTNNVSVQLIDTKTRSAVWAYSVKTQGYGNVQTTAEACAKHLKNWLDQTRK